LNFIQDSNVTGTKAVDIFFSLAPVAMLFLHVEFTTISELVDNDDSQAYEIFVVFVNGFVDSYVKFTCSKVIGRVDKYF
jgi:hypothetical protein